MKVTLSILLTGLLAVACGSPGAARRTCTQPTAPAEPVRYTYAVQRVYPHDPENYTQGLQYADGLLWEGTGQNGASRLLKTDLETGRSEVVARLPRSEFGEGIALLGGKVYQLTWTSNRAHVYDAATGRRTGGFTYPVQGWGLTTDGRWLYMSDGSDRIRVLDPDTFERERNIAVTLSGEPVRLLNELEWIEGKIWANVYTTDQIVIIDPATGAVEGIVDLSGLLPEEEVTPSTDVLNGIAYDPALKRIFVTGKNWSKLFHITLEKQE